MNQNYCYHYYYYISGVQMGSDLNSSAGRRVTGIGGNTSQIPHVNYSGSGKEYKDSLIRAAKARYDQINK